MILPMTFRWITLINLFSGCPRKDGARGTRSLYLPALRFNFPRLVLIVDYGTGTNVRGRQFVSQNDARRGVHLMLCLNIAVENQEGLRLLR